MVGQRSSGLLFCFWLGLVVYGTIKLRTLWLLSIDNVRTSVQGSTLLLTVLVSLRVVCRTCSDL